MSQFKPLALLLPLILVFSGCSISQQVEPVAHTNLDTREICIIRNKDVREGFLSTYQQALEAKGFTVKVLDLRPETGQCGLTSTYVANWRWDLAMYLAYVKISVTRDNELIGEATYDSLGGGGNLNKFIDAERKIRELVDQLFPQ